jgi:hypothetical protein
MKKLLTTLALSTLSALSISLPSTAQTTNSKSCPTSSEMYVMQLEGKTLCYIETDSGADMYSLYSDVSRAFSSPKLVVWKKGDVTIVDVDNMPGKARAAYYQRKFERWFGNPNAKLIRQYSDEISVIFDLADEVDNIQDEIKIRKF